MMLTVIVGLVLLVAAVGFLIYVASRPPRYRAVDEEPDEDEALLELRQHYLDGELTAEEYERARETLITEADDRGDVERSADV